MAEPLADRINAGLEDVAGVGHQLRGIRAQTDRIANSDLPPEEKLRQLTTLRDRADLLAMRSAELFSTLERLVEREWLERGGQQFPPSSPATR